MFGQSATGGGFGFGANNQPNQGTQNTGSVFGGGGTFGQPAQPAQQNTGSGFGTSSAFGQTGTTGAFGSGSGFGASGSGGFGTAAPAFGAKPGAFVSGNTGGGGLFGSSANTTSTTPAFGGFGGSSTGTTSAFGAPATQASGGLFGSKPVFGGTATTGTTGGGLFGTTSGSTGAFGSTGGGFGAIAGADASSTLMPAQGTATTPYQPFQEKEGAAAVPSHFQTITFSPPYNNHSLEELRLQDYSQGRRFGNASGTGGAFGFNTGFGGANTTGASFGQTNTGTTGSGLFGNTAQQSTGFGSGTAGAFGSTNASTGGGGLFGAAKPATTGGLFGSSNAGTTGGGGLFGSAPNTGAGAFGSSTTSGFGQPAQQNTGGGLFGNNQQQQAKPGFSFGATTTTPTTGTFGNTGGAFGGGTAPTGGGLFGNSAQQQQPAAGGGLFGGSGAFGQAQQQQPQQQTSAFGPTGFGANQQQQQKPAFGSGFGAASTTTSGGLFGGAQQQQPQQQAGGLFGPKPAFGSTAASGTGGGLFGAGTQNQQPQQGSSLFVGQTAATGTGGGLFGAGAQNQQQQQQQPGGGLFGSAQKPPSLFGTASTPTQAQGPGLFGGLNTNTQPQLGGPLFGNQQQQPHQGGSLFGGSILGQQQQQQQQFSTSISDSPYGNSLLSSVNGSVQNSPLGPIATPIGSQTKKAAMIPHHKIAPRQPNLTPRLGGSYSRSGSPFAASGTNSPMGAGGSLGRSFSSNNKLSLFDSSDSILNSGAFTPGGSSRVASLKKLVIDKKIRDTDLFSAQEGKGKEIEGASNNRRGSATKSILKKSVSFDISDSGSRTADDEFFSPTSVTPDRDMRSQSTTNELGYIRSTPDRRRREPESVSSGVQPDQSPADTTPTGKELALVQEPEENKSRGTYWMVPPASRLKMMPKEQQKKVIGLTVGRRGYGQVRFDHPVDVTNMEVGLEEIPCRVVTFEQRVCTVYPEGLDKPPPGKGLNVPATITLEDCFPVTKNERGKIRDPEHPRYITHIRRLKSIKDTEFVDYIANEGIWIFKVAHFTTYGLVDDDEDMTYDEADTSVAQTPTPRKRFEPATPAVGEDDSMFGDISGMDTTPPGADDTFDFKKLPSSIRSNRNRTPLSSDPFPGSFLGSDEEDEDAPYSDDDEILKGNVTLDGESFLGEGSAGSEEEEEEEPAEPVSGAEDSDIMVEDSTVIMDEDVDSGEEEADIMIIPEATPKALPIGQDWTEQLNHTISPVKRRFGGEGFFAGGHQPNPLKKGVMEPLNYGLLDLHNDLYGGGPQASERKNRLRKREHIESPTASKSGGARPTTKPVSKIVTRSQAAALSVEPKNIDKEEEWPKAVRAEWNRRGRFYFSGQLDGGPRGVRKTYNGLNTAQVQFGLKSGVVPKALELQLNFTRIEMDWDSAPRARADPNVVFKSFADNQQQEISEKHIWRLASVLWDPIADLPPIENETPDSKAYVEEKRRRELLSSFFQELVEVGADQSVASAGTLEDVAFAHLSAYRVEKACAALLEAGDYRLATLITMIGGDREVRELIKRQLNQWREKGVMAEVPVSLRALYELLAGNTCYSEGVDGPAEDFSPSFFFAEYFKLDWKRIFGLKLWYALFDDEPIAAAVQQYEHDVDEFPDVLEIPKPTYSNPEKDSMHPLWVLLRLYSDSQLPLEEIFNPLNFSSSSMSFLLPWQLATFLRSLEIRPMSSAAYISLTQSLSAALESAGLWEWSIFILLHIHDTHAIVDLITAHIDDPESEDKVHFLRQTLQIPAKWIEKARAIHAKYRGDHTAEAQHLLNAQLWQEAHRTIISEVAPAAIISGDHNALKQILARFGEEQKTAVEDWGIGGQVYVDYLGLLERPGKEKAKRLLGALKEVKRRGFLQGVAVREMSGYVAGFVGEQEGRRVLELPVTEDVGLKRVLGLGVGFWRGRLGVQTAG